jgi:hypothetical protein
VAEDDPRAWTVDRDDSAAAWDRDWYYHFQSDNISKEMEWADIRPDDKLGSMAIDGVESIYQRIGLGHELREDFVRVYGYRRTI